MDRIRVRFAPSPTGYLHIGGLRTALYNYLFARSKGGEFVLRIEDTDQKRFVDGAEQDILDSLKWAGISYDEGPEKSGVFGPYRQSERSGLYQKYAAQLLATGHAYLAFDTEEDLTEMRESLLTKENPNPRYDITTRGTMKNSLSLPAAEVERLLESDAPHVVRLLVTPGNSISFTDLIRGDVSFETDHVDDQVLVKSDGLPTYHLANIVDDHLMEITHVIRGEEWLSSTPKHILLYEALGWHPPQMAHLPLILSPTGGKLSKRGAERAGIPVSVRDYRSMRYEPGALINFLALLGWNPGDEREHFELQELEEAFSFERVGQAGVQFDMSKLLWFNEHYLRARSPASIAEEIAPVLEANGLTCADETLRKVANLMLERISLPTDILDSMYFFKDPVEYDEGAKKKRWKAGSKDLVEMYADRISIIQSFVATELDQALRRLAEDRDVGAGDLIHPVRLVVSGVAFGPGLFELLEILGRDVVVRRLRAGAAMLG